MERFIGKVAVVTGASAGIGLEISKLLVKHGLIVVGLARGLAALEELEKSLLSESYSGKFYSFKCDVSDTNDIKKAFEYITTKIGPIFVLINNAATLVSTTLFDVDEKDFEKAFDTNVKGLMMCSREAISSMQKNEIAGHIININSLLGHVFITDNKNDHMLYSVTKHAVTALTEALRREATMKNSSIKISSVSPGLVDTNFSERHKQMNFDPDKILPPEDVAQACIKVLDTPPLVLIPELTIYAIHQHV